MKKKCLSLLMILALLVGAAVPLSAAAEEEISTFGMNYTSANLSFSIDKYGVSTTTINVQGISGRVQKIDTETWLEYQTMTANGYKWVRKYGFWDYATYNSTLTKSYRQDLPASGDWRAVCTIVITGTYPSEQENLVRYASYNP